MRFRHKRRGLFLAASIAFAGMAWSAPSADAQPSEGAFLDANAAAMNKMMAGMAIKPTGEIDHDFVAMMVPHHQGAIDMAQAELLYGHNQKLLRIAQEIVVEQLQEIAAMRLAIGEPASPTWVIDKSQKPAAPVVPAATSDLSGEGPYLHQNDAAMDKMMTDMSVKPTGDVDRDFVAMMVPHHQGAHRHGTSRAAIRQQSAAEDDRAGNHRRSNAGDHAHASGGRASPSLQTSRRRLRFRPARHQKLPLKRQASAKPRCKCLQACT